MKFPSAKFNNPFSVGESVIMKVNTIHEWEYNIRECLSGLRKVFLMKDIKILTKKESIHIFNYIISKNFRSSKSILKTIKKTIQVMEELICNT